MMIVGFLFGVAVIYSRCPLQPFPSSASKRLSITIMMMHDDDDDDDDDNDDDDADHADQQYEDDQTCKHMGKFPKIYPVVEI